MISVACVVAFWLSTGVLCSWQPVEGGSGNINPLIEATKLVSSQGLDYRSVMHTATSMSTCSTVREVLQMGVGGGVGGRGYSIRGIIGKSVTHTQ